MFRWILFIGCCLPVWAFGQTTHTIPVSIDATPCVVQDLPTTQALVLYPNPTAEKLQFSDPADVSQVQVLSITGHKLQTHYQAAAGEVDVATLPPGIYLIRYYSRASHRFFTYKFSKQ